jgi:hypothetical protein
MPSSTGADTNRSATLLPIAAPATIPGDPPTNPMVPPATEPLPTMAHRAAYGQRFFGSVAFLNVPFLKSYKYLSILEMRMQNYLLFIWVFRKENGILFATILEVTGKFAIFIYIF